MRLVSQSLFVLLTASFAVAACDSGEQEPPIGSSTENLTQRSGIMKLLPELTFGETAAGWVDGKQLDLYAVSLRGGDKLTIITTMTEGDAGPDARLYEGMSTKVSSANFDVNGATLTKTYEIGRTGWYSLLLTAYQGENSGRYTTTIECNGGPCAGEPVVEALDEDQKADCIQRARECAFTDMLQYNGAVGAVRARSLFEGCLDKLMVEDEGLACAPACVGGLAVSICDGIIDLIPHYADQTPACLSTFGDCMDLCYDAAEWGYGYDGLEYGPEDMCLFGGFNGTCDSYAREHETCGGQLVTDSPEACYALCESTTGAHIDDLDTLCSDECG